MEHSITAPAPVRVSLLGGLRIESSSSTVPIERFQTQKTAALLAFLALQPTRAHGREFLVELLWPDSDEQKGRCSLRVALTSLRRQLEPPGVPNNMVLIADRNTVRLNFPAAVQTDVALFEQAATEATMALPDAEERLLDQALALYQGPLLPGFYDDWALRERERLVDLYRSLLLRRSHLLENRGGFAAALDYARRAVNLEEDREAAGNEVVCEDAHLAVIHLLTHTGRHEDARRQYDTFTRRLSEFYDEAPSPRARALLEKIQEQGQEPLPESKAPPLAKAPVQAIPTPAAERKSAASPPRVPRLPLVLSRFFGRGPETDQVHRALFVTGSRIVTLTGPGGSGKTRFALEFARRYAAEADAASTNVVFFASLADIDSGSPAPFWAALAEALGMEQSSSADAKTLRSQVMQRLMEAAKEGKFCLLALDNFETLVETGGPLLTRLLEDVPDLRLLITSRRRLGLFGEHEVPLPPLPVPPLPGTPERLLEWSSVQLFVDRAQAARPDFQITSRNAEAIAALCARLDGIPLALELTAAWAGVLSPPQMLARVDVQLLDEAGPPLAYHRSRRAERHRTLRAAIDSSFTLLSLELKEAFGRLSVFRGGWTLAAAENLLNDLPSPAADLLSRLRERSLIVAETSADGESLRFRMLDSLREFAGEMLTAEQNSHLRNRCAVYFTEYEAAACQAEGNNQNDALVRIDTEYPNYAAAIEWFAEDSLLSKSSILYGLRLSGSIGWYWLLRGYTKTGCDLCRHFLAAVPPTFLQNESNADYFNARLAALLSTAQLSLRVDSSDAARVWGEEALTLSLQGYGGISQRVEAYILLGTYAMAHGDYPVARTHYETALEYQKETGKSLATAAPLANLGLVCWYQGDFISAESYFTASLRKNRDTGERNAEAHDLLNLGLVACVREELDRSQALLEESLVIRREMKDQHGLVNVLGNLGEVLRKQNKENEAKEVLLESLSIARSLQDSQQISYALGILGTIAISQGKFPAAADFLSESISLLVSLGSLFHIQNALEAYAALAYAVASQRYTGSPVLTNRAKAAFERAVRFWTAADKLREQIGNFHLEEDQLLREAQIQVTRSALGLSAFEKQQAASKNYLLGNLVAETQNPL